MKHSDVDSPIIPRFRRDSFDRRDLKHGPWPPEFERAGGGFDMLLWTWQTELSGIVNTAIRVGRGTETLKNLAAMLEPYGIRRKA